jgi:hypothetical protein
MHPVPVKVTVCGSNKSAQNGACITDDGSWTEYMQWQYKLQLQQLKQPAPVGVTVMVTLSPPVKPVTW